MIGVRVMLRRDDVANRHEGLEKYPVLVAGGWARGWDWAVMV
jgi:hypothetical protein